MPETRDAALAESRGRSSGPTYALLVYGLTILIATGSVPTGLFQTYAEEFDFSPAVLTMLAAATTVGVIVAVLAFGRLSDAIGRRPVLLWGLGLGAVSLLGYLFANGVPLLLGARMLSGLAVGLFTGAATAALTELAPHGQSRRAATHAATAAIAGFAIGPLLGGAFVEYGPWPLRLVHAVDLLLLVPAFVAVLLMRETMTNRTPFRLRIERLGVPRDGRGTFALASLVALCAFAAASFFASLGPTFAIKLLDVSNRTAASAIVVCFLGTSAVAQTLFRGLPIRRQTVSGLVILPCGFALIVAGLLAESLPLFVAGAFVGGFGQGLAYIGGQSLVERVTPAGQRGETFSAYLVVVYVTGGGTAISLGLAAKSIGLHEAAVGYALIAMAVTFATAVLAARVIRDRVQAVAERVTPPV